MADRRAELLPLLGDVFRAHGFEGASLALITTRTGLGKGSLYHLFPGGKEEMAAAVLADVAAWFETRLFRPLREEPDPLRALERMFEAVDAYFRSGQRICLVGAFALGDGRDRFAGTIRDYFRAWRDSLAAVLGRAGTPAPAELAEEIVVAIQGALVTGRALDDPDLFGRTLRRLRAKMGLAGAEFCVRPAIRASFRRRTLRSRLCPMNVLANQPADPDIQACEPFSVSAAVSLQEQRYHTLKSGDTFGVFDHDGDILPDEGGTEGLYHLDTRHLSRFDLALNGMPPLLLSSTLSADNVMLTSDLANTATQSLGPAALEQGIIHVQRSVFLADGGCHGRLAIRNYSFTRHRIQLHLRFAADFADLFEVRGMHRDKRGEAQPAALAEDSTSLSYRGLDGVVRVTRIAFEPAPQVLSADQALFVLELEPRSRATIFFEVACSPAAAAVHRPRAAFLDAYVHIRRRLRASAARAAAIASPHWEFDEIARRAADDLRMLVTEKPTGPYPYAGIPWFSTAFGRDALITALLMLALDPAIACGVLRYLASAQATALDPASEAEPGKILHETRSGEMAMLREVPFRRYYGSVDSTPLFVMLAGAYLERTGDLATIEALWPNIGLALTWIDRHADAEGFVRYQRSTADGLANQGWKDSYDAISHADGALARGAIALCEVQGYAFAALRAGAVIAGRLGQHLQAEELERKAEHLRQSFEARFWCERLGTYALALDGEGRPCEVRASNAGHVLMTGIASAERGRRVAQGLLESRLYSGWGIRTLAMDEARYNPMSYHNGSVWPHDNAVIALGMARMGLRAEAAMVFEGMQAAAREADMRRLPELFCGFPRRPGQGPTSYPVACTPQAWAAAAIPALMQACLGLSFDPAAREVRFDRPDLPAFIDCMTLHHLSLGNARVSVLINRLHGEVSVSVVKRQGDIRVVTTS